MANKFQALLALLGKNKQTQGQAQGQTLVPMGEYPSIRGQSQIPIEENPLYLSMRGQAPAHVSMRAKQPTHVSMRGMKPPAEMDKNLLPPALMPIGEYPSMRGEKAPVPEMQDPRLDGLNKVLPNLPSLNTNATAQNAGVQTLQQAQWQQQHPLLAGIKKGANKAKHYLLDPVYNTPTGDASIDATDPNKFTDSRLGRYGSLALLAGAGLATGNPAMGALAGAKMVGGLRQNDLKEYQGRLGKKATIDEYGKWGYKPNPMLSEKQQAEGFKLFVENERNRMSNELLAEPDTTARIRKEMTPPQEVKVDPITGKKTYTGSIRQPNPYAITPDPKFYAGKQLRRQQQQNQQAQQALAEKRLATTEKYRDEQGRFKAMTVAEKTRHAKAMEGIDYYKAHKPPASKGGGKGGGKKASGGRANTGRAEKPVTELSLLAEKNKQEKLVTTSSLTKAEQQTYLAQIKKAYKEGIAKLNPKKATPKQEEAKKALLPAPNPKIKSKEGKAFVEMYGGAVS